MKNFHAHIYFEESSQQFALTLKENAEQMRLFDYLKIHFRPVGPHITGMIEAHFKEFAYTSVLKWIEENRGSFSVLIHQDSGDDYKDHTENIRWIGKELPLKFEFFDAIQMNPELRIH